MSAPESGAAVLGLYAPLFVTLLLRVSCTVGVQLPKSLQSRERRSSSLSPAPRSLHPCRYGAEGGSATRHVELGALVAGSTPAAARRAPRPDLGAVLWVCSVCCASSRGAEPLNWDALNELLQLTTRSRAPAPGPCCAGLFCCPRGAGSTGLGWACQRGSFHLG